MKRWFYAHTLLSLCNGGNVKWQQKLLAVIQLRCNLSVRCIGLICRSIHCLLLKSMKLSLQAAHSNRLIFISGKAVEFPGLPLPPAGDLDRGMWWWAIRRESDVVSWTEHNQETSTCKSTSSEGHEQRKEFTQRKSSARQDLREVHVMSSTILHGENSLLPPGFLTPDGQVIVEMFHSQENKARTVTVEKRAHLRNFLSSIFYIPAVTDLHLREIKGSCIQFLIDTFFVAVAVMRRDDSKTKSAAHS